MNVLAALVWLSSTFLVQQDRGTQFQVERLKERLGLSEDQTEKVRGILLKDSEERTKLEEARAEKINAVLNPDQKKLYDEMRSNQRGFRGGGGAFQNRTMGTVQFDDVRRELNLTDDQVEKIKPLYDEFNAGVQKHAEELRDKGLQGINFAEEMQKYQENLKALAEKVKVHLTEDQKAKLNTLMDRATGWMRMIPTLMRGMGTPSAPPRPSVDERVRSALAGLKIEKEEERAAIAELIGKVVKAQFGLEDSMKASRESLAEAARNRELSDAAVEDRIRESKEDRRRREKELASLQKQLGEVLTSRQELELMAQGILR